MRILKMVLGKILYGITKAISLILDVLIGIINFIVNLVSTVVNSFRVFIGMGGCLIFFLFSGSISYYILTKPYVLLTILFFVVFPLLGTKFISLLKYLQYTLIEYLFDLANYLISGTKGKFSSYSEYGRKYKKDEEAKRRKEQQDRQQQQQREWEEKFKQWQQYQNFHGTYTNFGGYGQYDGSTGQTYANPMVEFKKKYERSCDVLGIPYSSDKYQVKLAYRKKAKEYHPDINKSANATQMFQKVSDAYEFLSDNNIERYSKMQ